MKNTSFLKIFFFFVLLALSAAGQTPVDDTINRPPGYTAAQARWVNAIAIDSNDNKWIGFKLIGLGKLSNPKVWTMFDSLNSPLPTNNILSICCNASGVWAGTNAGLFNYNGTAWKSYTTSNSNIPFDSVPNLYAAGGNTLMIYSNNGIVYFNGTSFTTYNTTNSGLVNDTVKCVFQSAAGLWWIGTIHGLSSFDGVNWQSYTTPNTFPCSDYIFSLNEDKNNSLFIGSSGGLFIKEGSSISAFVDHLDNYVNPPLSYGNLLRLSDGRIFVTSYYSPPQAYFISTNPISFTIKDFFFGTFQSDSSRFALIDKSDRIWWITKPFFNQIRITDSLFAYPNLVLTPENYKVNYLDANEVKCVLRNDNIFFSSEDNSGYGEYIVPRSGCVSGNLINSSSLWIAGFDSSDKLHTAARTLGQNGIDFWPGPLDTIHAKLDSLTQLQYDSIWKVNRTTIDEFITQYWLGNVSNGTYKIPNIILNWPANGANNYSRNLAPFIDKNGDSVYNPYDGDYPDLKGDQMLWWVMNDNYRSIHSESGGVPLGIEIRSRAYAYSCTDVSAADEAVNSTTFYSMDIINRSDTDYHDVYVGIWFDSQLGWYSDDYHGCRIDGDYAFVYNGYNHDAYYGENPPMLSAAILKGPRPEPNDGIDNNHNGVTDEPGEVCMMNHFLWCFKNGFGSKFGNPAFPSGSDYHRYLHSMWRDSTHVTYGGNGGGSRPGATNIPTDYFLSGIPYDTGWTAANAGYTPGGNYELWLLSSGPFSLKKNESKTLDYAIVFSWDKAHPNGVNTSVAKNDADVRKVKHWFETDSFPCKNSSVAIPEIKYDDCGLFIYPNPARGQCALVFKGASQGEMELMDVTGRMIKQQTVVANQRNLIDVHDLMKGLYLVRVTDSSKSCIMKVVID